MLSPSDFNNAVPQFTNGDYASNPINPQYIAEPDAVDYNKGAEPLQTLPAQWWNWFLNRFTNRFNKVNIYVKNIFNELAQLLSLVSETPSGTEGTPTVGQLKDMFKTKYPDYLKTTPALSNTYVPQTTRVNGHELCENITITCVACAGCNGSGTAFGTASTKNTGTAAGCIPVVGTALGTTNGQFIATDASGCLKPSGYTASSFRSSSWTPSCVSCAGQSYCVIDFNLNTQPIYIGYAGDSLNSSQIGYLAAYSTTFCNGQKVIKDAPKGVVQCWLDLGSAAYCASSAFRPSTWYPTCVEMACHAHAYYSDCAIFVCLKCTGSGFGNCYYDVCVCSRTGGKAFAMSCIKCTHGCCSGLIEGHLIPTTFVCISCTTGQGLSSYYMPGIYLY